eukprot:183108-Rhodomonas_salina.3
MRCSVRDINTQGATDSNTEGTTGVVGGRSSILKSETQAKPPTQSTGSNNLAEARYHSWTRERAREMRVLST